MINETEFPSSTSVDTEVVVIINTIENFVSLKL